MTRRLSITVQGQRKTWSFCFDGDLRHLDEWRADGLEIDEVVNTIPAWVVGMGLTRPWCFVQDIVCVAWWGVK